MPKILIGTLRALSVSAGLAAVLSPLPLVAQSLFSPAITVNGDVVSHYELNQRAKFLRLLGAPSDPDKLAQDQMIEDRLKAQAADEYGVKASPEDVKAGMEEFAGRAKLSSDEFVSRLKEAGVDEQTFRDFVKVGMEWRDLVRGRFLSQSRPSDDEIERAMGTGGGGGLRVLLSEIVMPVTPENEQAVRARAEEISKLKSIDAFSEQAREVSATNTRDQGGKMDWIALNDLPPALRPAIIALSPGDVTPPLQLPNAIALFQLRDMGEITGKSTSYSAIDYATYLIPGGRTPEALAKGKQIVDSIDTCDDLYGVAKGQPAGTLQMMSQAPSKIPSDVAMELTKLDPGETSLALTRNNGQSLMLLMLCSRTAAVNEDATREQVANALTSQRLEAYANSYLDQLKANALIKIE